MESQVNAREILLRIWMEKTLSPNDRKDFKIIFLASDLIGEIFRALQTYPT
jgi:hypothetical protein